MLIQVVDAIKQDDYYVYKLVEQDGTKQVLRRYRHFNALRSAFVLKFPGMYVPPLPIKKTINNQSKQNI